MKTTFNQAEDLVNAMIMSPSTNLSVIAPQLVIENPNDDLIVTLLKFDSSVLDSMSTLGPEE